MLSSKYKTGPLIIKIFVALSGIGTITISMIMLVAFLNRPNNTSFIGCVMFLFISFIYFYLSAVLIRKYIFEEDYLRISICFGLVKFKYLIKDIKGYSVVPYKSKYKIYPGLAIATEKNIYHLSKYEVENYHEIETYVQAKIKHAPEIKLVFWTPILKFVTVSFAMFFIWVMASIILKIK